MYRGATMGCVGECHTHIIYLEKWIKMKSYKQAFAEEFSEPRGSVAECVVGKIYCLYRENPLSPAVGRMVLSGCGKRETHLSGK